MNQLSDFDLLLYDFDKVPVLEERAPTFMEISGYPYFENVCSNILQFYFNTEGYHNLDNLFLKSFLQAAGKEDLAQQISKTTDVYREVATEDRKRIDIVIECNNLIIAIENKISHWLHNDLSEYSSHIKKRAKEFENIVLVVLSSKPETNVTSGFINITYDQFFFYLKENLKIIESENNNRYLFYAEDFIKTIENHNKPQPMNIEMFNFIADNDKKINALLDSKKTILNELYNHLWKVSELIPEKGSNVKKWIWDKWVLVHDVSIDDDVVIAVDCSMDYKKTTIDVWVRRGGNDWERLNKLEYFKDESKRSNPNLRGYIVYEADMPFYEINPDKLAHVLNEVLNGIVINESK